MTKKETAKNGVVGKILFCCFLPVPATVYYGYRLIKSAAELTYAITLGTWLLSD